MMNLNILYDYNFKMLLPEIFLATSILMLTIYSSLIASNKIKPILINQNINLSLLTLFFVLLLLCNSDIEKSLIYSNTFIVDSFSTHMKVFVVLFTFLSIVIGKTQLIKLKINNFEYIVLILSACLGLMLLISSNDFLSLYLSLELQSLCLYLLAAAKKDSTFSTEAGLKYFIIGSVSSGFLLFGITMIYGLTGTVNFNDLKILFSDNLRTIPGFLSIYHALLLIMVAFFFKIGGAPFHMWVPDIYEGAPISSTLFFAIVPKLAIFVIFSRIFFSIFFLFNPFLSYVCLFIAFSSVIVGSLGALKQKKLKRLLAYSSISHVGYMLLAFSANSLEGIQALFFYLIIYMITNILLWTIVVEIENNNSKSIVDLAVISKKNKFLGFAGLIGLFSLMGIPPLVGFTAKMYVFTASINATFILVSIIAILTSVVSSYYYLRLIKNLYFEKVANFKEFSNISSLNAYIISLSTFLLFFLFFNPNILYLGLYNVVLLF